MTKQQWIDTIKNTIMKIDEQGIYREPLIEKHIQAVYEQMYNELYRQNPRKFDQYTQILSETYSGVTKDFTSYTLGTLPISLPRNNGGVFELSVGDDNYVLTSYDGYKYAKDSKFDTAGIMGSYVATIISDQVYSTGSLENSDVIKYRMIPKFTSLSLTEEVKIPSGMEDHFIDRVIDTIKHMTPMDLINDNTVQ